jgi:hypothetical protein
MNVTNPVRDAQLQALPTTTTPESLAKAISQLDTTSIPPERRALAMVEHVSRIMVGTLVNRAHAHQLISDRLKSLQPN